MRGPVTLLKDAWGVFASNPKLFIGIYIVPAIVMFAWTLFVYALDQGQLAQSPASMAAAVVFVAVLFVVNVLMAVAMMKAAADPDSSIGDAYRYAKQYFFSYLWVAILVTLATLAGLILFIIPGIIFAIWFTFSYFVLLFEDKRGVEAMKQSKTYVKGHWWAVFGRYLFLMLIGLVVSIVVAIVTAVVESGLENIGASIVTFLANAVIVPVAIAYTYLMYKDLSSGGAISASSPAPEPTPASAAAPMGQSNGGTQ